MKKSGTLKNFCIIIFASLISITFSNAQSDKAEYRKLRRQAEGYFIDEIFKGALPKYLQMDQLKPNDPEINYKIGVCYLHSATKNKAIPYFEKAKQKDKANEYSDIDYYLGVAYHYDHQFDKATDFYKKYKVAVDTNSDYGRTVLPTINKYISNCRVGKILVSNPTQARVDHLNTNINTPHSETYPVISPDGTSLYFSSQRVESTGGKIDDETDEYFEDIYVSTKGGSDWGTVKHIGAANTFKHDSPLCLTKDGKRLYFYQTSKNNTTDIFYTENNGTDWSTPVNLGPNINSKSGEYGASITSDGKVFYFSSDRPGGFGGMDIYVSRLQTDGTWGPAINIGPQINTSFDEESPYILPDDKTLFFSSDGPSSIGGLDIFRTQFNAADSSWASPVNLGFPVNTADHEFHVSWLPDGKKGYFSSFRNDTYGEEDIYYVELEREEPETKIFAATEDPKDYAMNKTFKKPLKGEALHQQVFFDFNIYSKPAEFSHEQLQEIVDLMDNYPDMLLEIGGHTDNIGGEEINKKISEKRAQTVQKYLIGRGVDEKRLTAKGYGFTKLKVNGKSTLENGPNRRVDFKVISNAEFYQGKDHSHIFKTEKKNTK